MAGASADRVILFTGSPLATSLKWEGDDVWVDLLPAFQGNQEKQSDAESSHRHPVWRSLPLEQYALGQNLTQLDEFGKSFDEVRSSAVDGGHMASRSPHPDGSTNTEGPSSETDPRVSEQLLTQYYEHSLALHDELLSSQIIESSYSHDLSLDSDTGEYSFLSSEQSIDRAEQQQVQARLRSTHLSSLKECPTASYLHSISPQTMSVNLVVGIIAIAQPRAIRTRRDRRLLELVEMTVGDETRSGFGVNIWLPPPPRHAHDSDPARGNDTTGQAHNLRDVVLSLRPRDIIFARRVGLSSFRGVVYGQSLRRGMTTVDLLYRSLVDADDICGAFKAREIDGDREDDDDLGQLAKVRRVKDWVMQFVGMRTKADEGKSESRGEHRHLPSLPLDTQ